MVIMMNNNPLISIVIGFRDWGLEKVCLCVKSHLSSSMAKHLEVIVVDYGHGLIAPKAVKLLWPVMEIHLKLQREKHYRSTWLLGLAVLI